MSDRWKCEECGAHWHYIDAQCRQCGNRTRVPERVSVATEHSIQDPFTDEITVDVLLDP